MDNSVEVETKERSTMAQGKKPTDKKATSSKKANGKDKATPEQPVAKPTVSHMLGEMTWLLGQSPIHKHFSIGDMEWMVMPALMLEQYRIFRGNPNATKEGEEQQPGNMPMGMALWATLSEDAETKLNDMVMGGKGPVKLRPDEWRSGDRLWLIDLVAPFATAENKQVQLMMADLIQNGLKQALPKAKDRTLKFHKTDPQTGKREVMEIKG